MVNEQMPQGPQFTDLNSVIDSPKYNQIIESDFFDIGKITVDQVQMVVNQTLGEEISPGLFLQILQSLVEDGLLTQVSAPGQVPEYARTRDLSSTSNFGAFKGGANVELNPDHEALLGTKPLENAVPEEPPSTEALPETKPLEPAQQVEPEVVTNRANLLAESAGDNGDATPRFNTFEEIVSSGAYDAFKAEVLLLEFSNYSYESFFDLIKLKVDLNITTKLVDKIISKLTDEGVINSVYDGNIGEMVYDVDPNMAFSYKAEQAAANAPNEAGETEPAENQAPEVEPEPEPEVAPEDDLDETQPDAQAEEEQPDDTQPQTEVPEAEAQAGAETPEADGTPRRDWIANPPQDIMELSKFYNDLPSSRENKETQLALEKEAYRLQIRRRYFGVGRLHKLLNDAGSGDFKILRSISSLDPDGNLPSKISFELTPLKQLIEGLEDDELEAFNRFKRRGETTVGILKRCKGIGDLFYDEEVYLPSVSRDDRLRELKLTEDQISHVTPDNLGTLQDSVISNLTTFFEGIQNDPGELFDFVDDADSLAMLDQAEQVVKLYYALGDTSLQGKHEELRVLCSYFYTPSKLLDNGKFEISEPIIDSVSDLYKKRFGILMENDLVLEDDAATELNALLDFYTEISSVYSMSPGLENESYNNILVENLKKCVTLFEVINNQQDFNNSDAIESQINEIKESLENLYDDIIDSSHQTMLEYLEEQKTATIERVGARKNDIDSFNVSDELKAQFKQELDQYLTDVETFFSNPFNGNDYEQAFDDLQKRLDAYFEIVIHDYYVEGERIAKDFFGESFINTEKVKLDIEAKKHVVSEFGLGSIQEVNLAGNIEHRMVYKRYLADYLAQMPETKPASMINDFMKIVREGLARIDDLNVKQKVLSMIRGPFTASQDFSYKFALDMDLSALTLEDQKVFIQILNQPHGAGTETFLEFVENQLEAYGEYDDALDEVKAELGLLRNKLHVNRGNHDACQVAKITARTVMQKYARDTVTIPFEHSDQDSDKAVDSASRQLSDITIDMFSVEMPESTEDREKHIEKLLELVQALKEVRETFDASLNKAGRDRTQIDTFFEANHFNNKISSLFDSGEEFGPAHIELMQQRKEVLDKLAGASEYEHGSFVTEEYNRFTGLYSQYIGSGYDAAYLPILEQYIDGMKEYHYPSYVRMECFKFASTDYAYSFNTEATDLENRKANLGQYHHFLQNLDGAAEDSTVVLLQYVDFYERAVHMYHHDNGRRQAAEERLQETKDELERRHQYSESVEPTVQAQETERELKSFKDFITGQFILLDQISAAMNREEIEFDVPDHGVLPTQDAYDYVKSIITARIRYYKTEMKSQLSIEMTENAYNKFDGVIREALDIFVKRRGTAEAELMDFSKNSRGKKGDTSAKRKAELEFEMQEASRFLNEFSELWVQGRYSRYLELENMISREVIEKRIALHLQRGGKSVENLKNSHERMFPDGDTSSGKVPIRAKLWSLLGHTPGLAMVGALVGSAYAGPAGYKAGAIGGAALGSVFASLSAYLQAEGVSLDDLIEEVPSSEDKKGRAYGMDKYKQYDHVVANLKYDLDTFIEDLKREWDPEKFQERLLEHKGLQRVQEIQLLRRYHLVKEDHPIIVNAMALHDIFRRKLAVLEREMGLSFAYSKDDVEHLRSGVGVRERIEAEKRAEVVKANLEKLIEVQIAENDKVLDERLDKPSTKGKRKRRAILKGLITGTVNGLGTIFAAPAIGMVGTGIAATAANATVHHTESIWKSFISWFSK